MQLPRALARLNIKVTNPIQIRWAGWIAPWVIVIHKGRVSGRSLRTPVLAWKRGTVILIGVLYGRESDWVLNLLAADGGQIVRVGRRYELRNPRLVDAQALDDVSPLGRWYARLSGVALLAELVRLVGDDLPAPTARGS